ncbi:MAG TPA: protein kinase [Terriglobales bacterium]|nr:protein kinase [Terriglobales bacterium]
MAPPVQKVGKYEVLEVLGKGGMGVVYKAMDPMIDRTVAIKMMTGGFAENPDLLKRFYREARATAMLQHPNIVIVYDLGEHEGNPYLVMEFLEGEALDKVIASRREVSLVQKLDYIIQALNGLSYAHQKGIVHRDIKPGNLIILRDGAVKIVDFGIARMGDASLTRTGQVVGTITYMSPEQINAQVVDGRTDVFSCGVMLYELLTFKLPFDGKDTASTLLKIIHEPPPPLKNYLPVYPPELEECLHRALAKDREERYATAEDFAFDLSRVQESLKKQMVSEYVNKAKESLERSEFSKAKELLQQVLRVDTQHSVARELMHEVQTRMQRQARGEQIKQLRAHAEDALQQKQFDDAISYLEQAITLDKANTELRNLRDEIQAARDRKKKVDEALARAEAAQHDGDLEAAARALQEVLAADPDNTQAKALHAAVSKELQEKSRQKQVQGYLEEARKAISGRKFTSAFEVLTKAEQIDPASPEVHALKNLASSGREQEQRRRDLEKLSTEIQDLLNREQYAQASEQANAALQKFPSDPALLKLKALADKQKETADRKKFVDEQVAEANKLVAAGKQAEALAVLEKAVQKAPGERRLQSLLAVVRDSAEREKAEQRKNEFIAEARKAIGKKDYAAAVKILEEAQDEVEGSAEINDLLQFARDEAVTQARRRKIEAAAEEATRLINDEEFERAVSVLEATMKDTPDEELKVVLVEAKRRFEDFNKKVEGAVTRAKRLLEARNVDEAVSFLEKQPKSFARSNAFTALLEKARTEQDQIKGVSGAIEKSRESATKGDFSNAVKILEACKKTYGETPELKQAIADLEAKRASIAKTALEKAVRDARALLLGRQYAAALKGLDAVADLAPAAPPELRTQWESLRKDASSGASRMQKEVELGKTIVAGSAEAGQTMVAGSAEVEAPAAPARGRPAPARAPSIPQPPLARPPVPPPAPARSPMLMYGAIGVVVVLVLAVGAYFALRKGPVEATAYMEINAVPWGTVKSVTNGDGEAVQLPAETHTPLRLRVPPGEYKVVVAGPSGVEKSETLTVSEESPGSYTPVFEAIDVEQILRTY